MFNSIYTIFLDVFRTIWQTMKSIDIAGITNVADLSIAIVLIGVFLSIFISFVNVNNLRGAYGTAERKRNRKH